MPILEGLRRSSTSFNGAGMFLSRKYPIRGRTGTWHGASMGPGCFYPGNTVPFIASRADMLASMGPGCFYPGNAPVVPFLRLSKKLQWGRDVSIPEMRCRVCYAASVCSASMGPGCFYPGNLLAADRGIARIGASMGPGCFYPGNGDSVMANWQTTLLQWGRDVSIPEMATA